MRESDLESRSPDDRSERGLLRALLNLLFAVALIGLLVIALGLFVPQFPSGFDGGFQPTPSAEPPPAGERNPSVTDPEDPGISHYETNVEEIDSETVEDFVHAEVNDRRADHDLDDLDWDGTIASVSRAHSHDMEQREYFAHTNPDGEEPMDRFRDVDDYCRAYGENIARTHVDDPVRHDDGTTSEYHTAEGLAEGLVDQWMNSTPHRQAILEENVPDGWDRAGVGVHVADDGTVHATQNFCREAGTVGL